MKTETASTSNSLQSPVQVEKLDTAIFLRVNFLGIPPNNSQHHPQSNTSLMF